MREYSQFLGAWAVREHYYPVSMRAIQIQEWGGPEVLAEVELPEPTAGSGQVLINVEYAGVNFADTHQRTNEYIAKAELPLVPGVEVAGIRADTGERVVAYTGSGGYSECALANETAIFRIPDDVSSSDALALFVQGVTAYHLLVTAGRLADGASVVVHSAAGGVGSLMTQIAKPLGAKRVIATASNEVKRELTLRLGADVALDGMSEDLTERLIEANDGQQVDLVIDAAGGVIFDRSFEAVGPFGGIVVNGISSNEKNTVSSAKLLRTGRFVAGFWFRHLLVRPEMISEALERLYALHIDGDVSPLIGGSYPLGDASVAHADLASRKTTGKLLLDARN